MIELDPLNISMSLRFLVTSFFLLFIMKLHSLIVAKQPFMKSLKFYFLTPLPSYDTWKRSRTPSNREIQKTLAHALIFLVATLLYYFAYWKLQATVSLPHLGVQYLAAPLLWLIGEWIIALLRIIALVSGRLIPPHHLAPPLSTSLTAFWSKRWNTWFYDWFHQVLFKTSRRRPFLGIVLTFSFSGIGHELVINLPFYLLTGVSVFGTMMAFFLLQAAGIVIDNRVFKRAPALIRLAFLWVWLLATAPLFMNEGTLRLIHAIH